MAKRYYLLLVFQDRKKDKLDPYGEDLSKASETFDSMRQNGGPDGIASASIVTSSGRIIKYSQIYSKGWHAEQARRAREQSASTIKPEPETPTPETPEQEVERLRIERLRIDSRLLELGVDALKGGDAPTSPSTGSPDGSAPSAAGDGGKGAGDPSTGAQTSLV